MIYDAYGRKVDTKVLRDELAATSIGQLRSAAYGSIANSLTPYRLSSLLLAATQGDGTDYLTLAEEMEERDLHYHSVLGTRKMAVAQQEVTVDAASDDAKDIEAADLCREVVQTRKFRQLAMELLDALGKGYSVVEILWDTSGKRWRPKEYKWRDPRWFQVDRDDLTVLRMRSSDNVERGIDLPPYKFLVHYPRLKTGLPLRGGLARLAAVMYMTKSYTLKDWLVFAEVFGMPLRLGKYAKNATDDQKTALLSAVTNIGTDAAAIIPQDMSIDVSASSNGRGGELLFQGLADWANGEVSKAVLGQTMTSEDGSSRAQADVHNDVRRDIRVFDSSQLEATIEQELLRPLIDLNFGPREIYPTIKIGAAEPEDLSLLSQSLPVFIDRGLRVEASVIRDKFGLPEPEEGATVLGAGPVDDAVVREQATQHLDVELAAAEISDGPTDDLVPDDSPLVDSTLEGLYALLDDESLTIEQLTEGVIDLDPDLETSARAIALLLLRAKVDGEIDTEVIDAT